MMIRKYDTTCRRLLSFLLLCIWYAGVADADMLIVTTQPEPLYGRLVEQDAGGGIVFQVHSSDPTGGRRLEVASNEVVALVVNIETGRLEQLDPANPEGYRDYAEELAAQKADPEARELAIRLYLIVLVSGDDAMQRSALSGLTPLSRDVDELAAFEMLRFVAGGATLDSIMATDPAIDRETAGWLLELVQSISRKRSSRSNELLSGIDRGIQQPGIGGAGGSLAALDTSLKELDRLATANELSSSELLKLLTIEQQLIAFERGDPNPIRPATDWATLAQEPALFPAMLPTAATVTEFDPARNRYRDGQWVAEE